jgi:hypothetical protein
MHKFAKMSKIWWDKLMALLTAVATGAALAASAAVVVPAAYERSFTIAFPGYIGSETLTDFPVLVKISPALNDFDYSACKVANGGDLRFADADGNLLASEVATESRRCAGLGEGGFRATRPPRARGQGQARMARQ